LRGKGHDGNFGLHPKTISGYNECLVDDKIPRGLSLVVNLLGK
jgi:hypothetical protein